MNFKHISVLLNETINSLNIKEDGIYVDCTLGGGGHSIEILKRLSKNGRLIGIDQDKDALKAASEKLKEFTNITYVHNNFYNIDDILEELKINEVDGIMMDLGVSSYQLDEASRGFSYMNEAPLDMRMDRNKSFSAYDVVNSYSEQELFKMIIEYGEDSFARRIARNIVKKRVDKPIETTKELVEIIDKSIPSKFKKKGHPAKKTFQAIRIEVNKELDILDKAITDSVSRLKKGGRLSIITFHSLEDRIVKNKYKLLENPCTCPPDFPICVCGKKSSIKIITRKPIEPTEGEKEENSRSKSAKLRVCEKI